MSLNINYKLVYEVTARGLSTEARDNLRIRFANEAHMRADAAHEEYRSFLRAQLGHDDFEVTNIVCMAEGIAGHVYVRKPEHRHSTAKDAGHRVCVFCGLDDFDF